MWVLPWVLARATHNVSVRRCGSADACGTPFGEVGAEFAVLVHL